MPEPGLCSAALEEELLGELRRHGIVVWLDKDAAYSAFVDALQRRAATGSFAYPVVAFRGSFLQTVLALEPYGNSLDKSPLLIHMPGFNEESIRRTPVLELYEAGYRFRKSLDTLVQEVARGRVTPAELQELLAQPGLTLHTADAWLAQRLSESREGLAGLLAQMSLGVVVDELLVKDTFLLGRLRSAQEREVLKAYLQRQLGIDEPWHQFIASHDPQSTPEKRLAAALAAWLLCVEYVHDLKRPPHLLALQPLRALSPLLVEPCVAQVHALRSRHADLYARLADEVETMYLFEELPAIRPEDLGQVDTFPIEETRVLEAAIAALKEGAWDKALSWAEARSGERSFWLQRDQIRRCEWSLVGDAARLGAMLARHPTALTGARSLGEAMERYASLSSGAFEVDRCHRRFEQQRLTLLESRLPHYTALQEVVFALRQLYRKWADRLARDFSALCKEHGFLPDEAQQQRNLFDQVVFPLTQGGDRVALLVIDAFRYEMATELLEDLKSSGTTVDLKARLAELPTLTAVGMNVLAPVAGGGRLLLASKDGFTGFRHGEFTVRKPEDRARAMGVRSVGKPALQLTLAEVCDSEPGTLKNKVAQARLLVVHSTEIDDAGEANVGLATFDQTLRQIRGAWQKLYAAGVKQFVFTADHGFLLQDETTAIKPYGSKRDPSRRHVLASEPRAETGMVNVSLSALGYDGADGFLLLREDTAVFATGVSGATFVHGGNSLQERVIPVLVVGRKREANTGLSAYLIEAQPEEEAMGLSRLRLRVQLALQQTGSLGFVATAKLGVALRVPDRPDIQVLIKGTTRAQNRAGRLEVKLDEWAEVFFSLVGPRDERVRVELFHPDGVEQVTACRCEGWFQVVGGALPESAAAAPATPPATRWQDNFPDEGARKAFAHIEQHGAITEVELTRLLGSARAFRRFSLEFESHARQVPFKVRIETAASGKRYMKDGEG
jgi:hypothetical protein